MQKEFDIYCFLEKILENLYSDGDENNILIPDIYDDMCHNFITYISDKQIITTSMLNKSSTEIINSLFVDK